MPITQSAGLVILHDNKILLEHPTGSKWYGTYSIPKGEIEEDENIVTAALRETYEEIGIQFYPYQINPDDKGTINYLNNKGQTYKKVHFYIIELEHTIELNPDHFDKKEIDWAGFLTKEEAEKRISPRLKSLLEYIK